MESVFGEAYSEDTSSQKEAPVETTNTDDATQEPVVENNDTAPAETVTETTAETTEPTEPVVETSSEPVSLTDESVLNYLKEKGIEAEGFDSLKNTKEDVFANDYIKGLNDFMRQTGRTKEEYDFVQTDLSQAPEQELIMQKLKMDNPQLTDRQVKLLFNNQYKKVEIDEDLMDETEIAEAKESNELVDIKMQQDGMVARSSFLDLQESFKIPEQNTPQTQGDVFDSEGFKSSFRAEADSIESISFDIGNDKTFDFVVDKDSSVEAVTPDEFMSRYENEDGSFNYELFATHSIALQNLDKIIASAASSQRSEGKEEVVRDLKNVNLEPRENNANIGASGLSELARAMMES